MKVHGVLFFLAIAFSILPPCFSQSSSAPLGYRQKLGMERFGVPIPPSNDPEAWQRWRPQVETQLAARRTRIRANDAAGASSGMIETIAGAAPFQKPVNALQTGFGLVEGIAEDSHGNLYVASCDLGIILKVDSSWNTTVYAGQPLAVGPALSSGDGGPATTARLPCPTGLAFDGANTLYVTDSVAGTVRTISADTGKIETIAGTPGQSGHAGDGGPATSALLEFPTAVTLDGGGNLYVADLKYIREVNLASGRIRTIAGVGSQLPQCWLSGSTTCPATQVNLYMAYESLGFAKGQLYAAPGILSVGSAQPSGIATGGIVTIDPANGTMRLLAGGGPAAGASSTYPAIGLQLAPEGIAVDSMGDVFISGRNQIPSTGANSQESDFVVSVDELSASDNTLHVVAGASWNRIYSGDGGTATKAGLRQPQGICFSPAGDVVFLDFTNIRMFPLGGSIQTIAGNGTANYFGDDGPASNAGLDGPSSVASDQDGNIYVADAWNALVRRIDAVTGEITTVAGGGQIYGTAADGGSALQAGLAVSDIAADEDWLSMAKEIFIWLTGVSRTSGRSILPPASFRRLPATIRILHTRAATPATAAQQRRQGSTLQQDLPTTAMAI